VTKIGQTCECPGAPELGLSPEEIGRRLEMDSEEVDRLADRGDMRKRGGHGRFGNGWTV
jgi:hypothetical protein